MTIISSDLLHSTGVVISGISTRRGGVSPEPFGMNLSFNVGDAKDNVRRNRGLFAQALGITADHLAVPTQQHSNVVRRANTGGSYPACDGLVTDTPGVYLCLTVADCVPIFIVDSSRRAIAAIHAGWRGTSAGIAERAVSMLVEEFRCRPDRMAAYLGPCAGKCCYVVGEDVAGRFSREFLVVDGGRIFVDLKAANVSQLVASGVPQSMIDVSSYCTIHEADLFHSYRRDGASSGRMMGAIGLRPDPVH